MARSTRRAVAAVAVGVVHAVLVVGVALRYGYDVGPAAYPIHELAWRYGGLVVLGALPVWLALEDRLLLPFVLVAVLAGLAFHAELTPPGPTFRDVAELEPSIEGPTGITVVEDGLHLVKYASPWYVWTIGAALLGAAEHVARARNRLLPDPGIPRLAPPRPGAVTDSVPARALVVAVVAGAVHATASIGYARRWGIGDEPLLLAWVAVGGVLVVGLPTYLLLRRGLVVPTAVVAVLFVNSVRSQQYAGPGDPHGLYVGAWFVFLAIALLGGGIELLATAFLDRVD